MSVTKRITSDYLITNKDVYSANVTVSTHTLFIDGNLLVGGNSTAVIKTDTEITDNTITLNKGETGAGVSLNYSGIEVDRGILTTVGLRWNESGPYWELSNDGVTYAQVASALGGLALTELYADPSPQISANLEITGHSIFDANVNVQITANAAGMGATGVYTNTLSGTEPGQELITKNRSLVYSIIL